MAGGSKGLRKAVSHGPRYTKQLERGERRCWKVGPFSCPIVRGRSHTSPLLLPWSSLSIQPLPPGGGPHAHVRGRGAPRALLAEALPLPCKLLCWFKVGGLPEVSSPLPSPGYQPLALAPPSLGPSAPPTSLAWQGFCFIPSGGIPGLPAPWKGQSSRETEAQLLWEKQSRR